MTSPTATPSAAFERGGSPSVEAALIAVVVALVLAFAIAAGRVTIAESAAGAAAQTAARAASIERDPIAAETAARRVAQAGLDERGLQCVSSEVEVDTTGFAMPLGAAGSVTVRVACAVEWSDLGLPGAPGTHPLTASATSPIDQWRERT